MKKSARGPSTPPVMSLNHCAHVPDSNLLPLLLRFFAGELSVEDSDGSAWRQRAANEKRKASDYVGGPPQCRSTLALFVACLEFYALRYVLHRVEFHGFAVAGLELDRRLSRFLCCE